MTELNLSAARARLAEVLDRVAAGEEITITRHGEPVAVLLRPDAVRPRRAQETIDRSREIGSRLAAARDRVLEPAALAPERAEELVDAIRAERDRS